MKTNYIENIKTLQEHETAQDFFMIKLAEIKLTKAGKEYLDFVLCDKTGEINGKKWDMEDEDKKLIKQVKVGDLVKVRGSINIWGMEKQLRITKWRKAIPNDNLKQEDYIRAAPENSEKMFRFIFSKAEEIEDSDLRMLSTEILKRNKDKLIYYPAATRNHHALYGGLLYHMKRMLMAGEALCQVYENLDRSLVSAGVILHDMEKLREIEANEMGLAEKYTFEGNMLGHLVLGVRELEKYMTELGFDEEKKIMVEHMILAHHYEPEFGSPKRPMFPEAELLHYLDVLDARMYDMEEVLKDVPSGEFSDKVWILHNRMLYKRKEGGSD